MSVNFKPVHFDLNVKNVTRHLNEHSVKPNPNPEGENDLTTAYGLQDIFKLARSLSEGNTIVRRKALQRLLKLYANPINIVESIPRGMPERFFVILEDHEDDEGRVMASQALLVYIRNCRGREVFLNRGTFWDQLAFSLTDPAMNVRINIFKVLGELCLYPKGLKGVLEERFVYRLIECIKHEQSNPSIQVYALDVLAVALADKMAVATLLEVDHRLSFLWPGLEQNYPPARASTAHCLAQIARDPDGNDIALRSGAISQLSPFLNDASTQVRTQTCSALMFLALDIRGKQQLVECGAIPLLVNCLHDISTSVRMFALQCMSSAAEHPDARVQLNTLLTITSINELKGICPEIEVYAERALKQIQWMP